MVDVSPIVVGGLGVVAAALQHTYQRRGGGERGQLKTDLELYALLPDTSASRVDWLNHIDTRLAAIIKEDTDMKRDPFGVVLGVVLLMIGAALVVAGLRGSGWWILGSIPLLVFGVGGLAVSVPREKRDDKGNKIT